MRTIFIAVISAAFFALAACSSPGSGGSIMAPSVATNENGTGTVSPTAACPQCSFTATPFSGGASTWSGPTTANTAPSSGHHGYLSVTFAAPFMGAGGSTLSWSGFHKGAQAVCTITDDQGHSPITVPCDDGSLQVSPTVTTVYTFRDTKNPPQSQDDIQTASLTVTVPNTVNFTATWNSAMGAGDDDPGVMYHGTATGTLSALVGSATSPTRCGLGGNGPANAFHATMALVDATHITGSYSGIDCSVDAGTFRLVKQ